MNIRHLVALVSIISITNLYGVHSSFPTMHGLFSKGNANKVETPKDCGNAGFNVKPNLGSVNMNGGGSENNKIRLDQNVRRNPKVNPNAKPQMSRENAKPNSKEDQKK